MGECEEQKKAENRSPFTNRAPSESAALLVDGAKHSVGHEELYEYNQAFWRS